jgi:hypothetical protein
MGMDLSYYSKKRIEKVFNEPIEKFLTDDGFYNDNKYNNKKYDDCYCYIGRSNCIDDEICGYEMWSDFNSNTIYTNCGDCFDKKVNSYNKTVLINLLEKIKNKMVEYGLDNEEKFEIYRSYGNDHLLFKHIKNDYIFPFYNNVIDCLDWLNKLDVDDEIILIAI